MPQAWQARDIQRQKFLEKLTKEFHAELDRLTDGAEEAKEWEFYSRQYIRSLMIKMLLDIPDGEIQFAFNSAMYTFWQNALIKVKEFARAKEEEQFLLWQFFAKIATRELEDARARLGSLELSDCKKILLTESRTQEVELPDDEEE